MQMILSMCLGVFDALLQNLLGLLNELSVQIDRVGRDASVGVVLAKDELGRLLVILFHLAAVRLALLREFFGFRAIAARVCLFRLIRARQHLPCTCLHRQCHCAPGPGGINPKTQNPSSANCARRNTYPLETLAPLRGFLAREIAQAIVLGLGVAALVVVEGWESQHDTYFGIRAKSRTYPWGPSGTLRATWRGLGIGRSGSEECKGAIFKWGGTRKIESDPDRFHESTIREPRIGHRYWML